MPTPSVALATIVYYRDNCVQHGAMRCAPCDRLAFGKFLPAAIATLTLLIYTQPLLDIPRQDNGEYDRIKMREIKPPYRRN